MTTLRIDPGDARPPFEQLRRQLVAQIAAGELPPGTKLPPVRRLAADLALAPNTVARAYRELESEGYLVTQGRNGTLVAPSAATDAELARRAATLAESYVGEMRRLGLAPDAIIGAVRRALDTR
ncbi:GntR family transcriptional regulator [Gulosibacter sp. 10]|uniref:GntR family transcriptional regulator n=1 Tax=Gulosibacter sp. 10 TaxID=1255570 RepID=UPI000B34DC92|nr:GntR family transcriptional regulator [Gulosibacter sp. 10]